REEGALVLQGPASAGGISIGRNRLDAAGALPAHLGEDLHRMALVRRARDQLEQIDRGKAWDRGRQDYGREPVPENRAQRRRDGGGGHTGEEDQPDARPRAALRDACELDGRRVAAARG